MLQIGYFHVIQISYLHADVIHILSYIVLFTIHRQKEKEKKSLHFG